MKNSLVIVGFFSAGIAVGLWGARQGLSPHLNLSYYALCGLLLLIGVSVGGDHRLGSALRSINLSIVLVPLSVMVGTLSASLAVAAILPGLNTRETMAVGAGFGYYSLSSVIITRIQGPGLGTTALLANIIREIITLLTTPFLVRYLGRLAPIAAGGATAMDTTLPVIVRFAGKEYAVIAVFSGIVLTLLVPVLVTLFL